MLKNRTENKLKAIIFDMDGTLYQFPDNKGFGQSSLGITVRQNIVDFLAHEFSMPPTEAEVFYSDMKKRADRSISVELEEKYNISRTRFFDKTWDIHPKDHIVPADNLAETINQPNTHKILLSAAPRIWVDRALDYMGVSDLFNNHIHSGESDIRKPDPDAFKSILGSYAVETAQAVSIGDQEHTDISPAQQIGMITIKIGGIATKADFLANDISDAIKQLQDSGHL